MTDDGSAEELYRKALNSATRMLARRQHAAAELRRKLAVRFEDAETVDRVIDRLGELGYLDDIAFAREYARQRFGRSPRPELAVVVELEGRGVGRADAEAGVRAAMAEEELDDSLLAERAARRKLESLGGKVDGRTREKLFRFLGSRGFSASQARRVVLDVLGGEGETRV